ncbi:hypothetical protein KY348_02550 [Candidatus Woesearchaeota archaeon]|nr:hypothetical protein [Candidatus Woesearchaeota archaeon]
MSVIINYLLWELGQSEYDIKIDPNKNKGRVKVKNQRLGKLELDLIKGAAQGLKAQSIQHTFPNRQKITYGFQKQPAQPQRITVQPLSNSLYDLIKDMVVTQLSNTVYDFKINPKTNKYKLKASNLNFGNLELSLIKDKNQGLKAKTLQHTTPGGQTTTHTF